MLPDRPTIGIIGPFGFGNLGDAAIQQAMLQNIQRYRPDAAVFGLSLNPADTEQRHGIGSFSSGRIARHGWLNPRNNPRSFVTLHLISERLREHPNRALRTGGRALMLLAIEVLALLTLPRRYPQFDTLIFSGGGQLDDYWGGPWHHPYSMLVWALITKLRRATVHFVSVGAGPLDHWLSRRMVHGALALATYRSYRDEGSKRFMARTGFRRDDPVYPDLAHSLCVERYLAQAPRHAARRVVGIGPMAYFDPRIWPERDHSVYEGYLTKLADLAQWQLDQGAAIVLFPGEAEHDRHVIADLRDLLERRGIERTDPRIIAPPVETVDELMTQLAATDLVIASRFHGVLLAQLLNKPVLALAYHPKVDHLMADMGQAAYCLPIDSFTVEAAQERFTQLAANCAAIKVTMAQRTQEYREALDEQYRRIFADN